MLRAVFKLRDAVRFLRSRVIGAHEFPPDGPSQQSGPVTQQQVSPDMEHVYQNRWSQVTEAMAQLDAQLHEAEVLWGDPFPQHSQQVRTLIEKLRFNVSEHLAFMRDPDLSQRVGVDQVNEVRRIVLAQSEGDSFSGEFEDALDKLQEICVKHLHR